MRVALVGTVLLRCLNAYAAPYLNSTEPICDGSDPTVLLCDDWEDGVWMTSNCGYNGGPTNPDNDGWCGVTSYLNQQTPGLGGKGFNPPAVPGYAVCGNAGAGGTRCAATSAARVLPPDNAEPSGGYSHGMMADHDLLNGQTVSDFYIRFYLKLLNDYDVGSGNEKVMTHRDNAGNCCLMFLNYNAWVCSQTQLVMYADRWYCQNQANDLTLANGHWYYVEAHYRLNTAGQANGVYELWLDDCGTNGLACTGPGTLRASYSNVTYRTDGATIANVWIENYANAPTSGTSYYDQLIVRTRRIGPMVTSAVAPTAPSDLRVR